MSENNNQSNLPQREISIIRLPKLGNTVKLSLNDSEITDQQKAAIKEFMDVEELQRIDATLTFRDWARDGVQVDGEIHSAIATQCPVSLKPVAQNIDAEFNAKFVPPESRLAKPQYNEEGEMVFDMDGEDLPDVFEGETLDAWAIAIEYLMLEIDYFARDKDAHFEPLSSGSEEEEISESPFAKLKQLKH